MQTTEKVAKLVCSFRYEKIPPRGVEQAKAALIDAVGVSLLGAEESAEKTLMKYASDGTPEARIWATREKTTLRNAVLVNSACVHAIDYDNGGALGHPSCLLAPAVLGLAEMRRLTGRQVIEAYTVGVELGGRLRESLGNIQMGAGWHATSLLGPMAVAAACAKLLELDEWKTRMAIALAAPLGGGMLQSFGTNAKAFQVARAAESGVLAALLAAEGCEGDPCVLEERKGFYYVYGQEQGCSIKQLTANFAEPVLLAKERGHFKQWPCCGGNYEVLSALTDLLAERMIPLDEIEHITVAMSMQPPGPVIRVHPRNADEGRFSIAYNVASCLVDGNVGLDTFTDEKFDRPIIHELMDKVELVWAEECAGKPARLQGESRFIDLTIRFRDGSVITRRQNAANRKQLEAKEVYGKYAEIARRFGKEQKKIDAAVALMQNFEQCSDAKEFLDLAI